jgi:hypothetical protein
MAVRRDVVEGVRALIETFGGDENLAALEGSSSRLQDSLRKIQENPQPYATYIVIAFAAVTIRWAAHEFGRTELEIVDELARSFGVN